VDELWQQMRDAHSYSACLCNDVTTNVLGKWCSCLGVSGCSGPRKNYLKQRRAFNRKQITRQQKHDTLTRSFAPVTFTLTPWPWYINLT